MGQLLGLQRPAGQPSPAEESSSRAAGGGGAAAALDAPHTPAAAASSAAARASLPWVAAGGAAPQRDPRLIAGAELYEQHLRRALAVPAEQRDSDVCSFLDAHAALEAAADALEAEEGAAGTSRGGSSSSRPGPSPGSEERQLLAAARYFTATWASATAPGLRHPRLVDAHGPPSHVNHLLWSTVAQPVISMNFYFWLPAPSVTLPNEHALRWSEPGAPRLDARRLLLLLLLSDAMSVGMGAAGALRFLAAAQRTLRNPRAAQHVAAGLAAMAARAGGGSVAPSVHELSVAW